MNKTVVSTDKAPKAIGPYSQAIKVGEFVYTAGQIALDPATGELVGGGVEAQTRRVLQNLTEVLKAAGTSMDKVIKTTVFMVNLAEFNKMNAVYAEFFPKDPPARSTVQVAALPKMGVVEIEVVAMM
jgi:2-iminobutanoate/2-iminopropanoate deaminase